MFFKSVVQEAIIAASLDVTNSSMLIRTVLYSQSIKYAFSHVVMQHSISVCSNSNSVAFFGLMKLAAHISFSWLKTMLAAGPQLRN